MQLLGFDAHRTLELNLNFLTFYIFLLVQIPLFEESV
jgi:hypothetical protein